MEFEIYSHPTHDKRTHSSISESSRQTPPTWVASQANPSFNLRQTHPSSFHFTVPTLRYEGDGLDFRRPIMSTPRQEVIDLTGDAGSPSSRLSGIRQYGRPGFQPHARISRTPPLPPPPIPDVISIDDHDDTPGGHVNAGSPEVELLFTRTLLPTMMPHSRPYGARPPLSGRPASPPPMRSAISYSQSTGGQPSWAEWRNQGQRRHRFDAPLLPEDMYPQRHRRPEGFPRGPHSHTPSHIQTRIIGDLFQNRDSMFMNGVPDIELPGGLNFTAQGFVMNTGNQAAVNARARPPPPTYEPPSPPRAGYTRDPREEDILLCPNCEEELGVGGNDTKKQVWVIKRCGHVYCGECTKHRQKSGRLKGQQHGLPKPFSKCVVEACGAQSVSHSKSFFQVYL